MKIPLLQVLSKKEHKLVNGYQVTKNSIIAHEGDACENVGVIVKSTLFPMPSKVKRCYSTL